MSRLDTDTLHFAITIGDCKRVQQLCGVNLMAMHEGQPTLYERLILDPVLLVDVMYCVLKPRLDVLSITAETFGSQLDGQQCSKLSRRFFEALVFFFRGLGRTDLENIMTRWLELVETLVAKSSERVMAYVPDLSDNVSGDASGV